MGVAVYRCLVQVGGHRLVMGIAPRESRPAGDYRVEEVLASYRVEDGRLDLELLAQTRQPLFLLFLVVSAAT